MKISSLKRFAAAACAALGFALPAHATSYSTDFSDLWWAGETENGWGINFVQQAEVIFATMFVYGQDNSARWFVASNLSPTTAGGTTFEGPLYRTTGPYFGGAWTANAQSTPVGTMRVAFNGTAAATLTYTVDGTSVSKNISRQTWRVPNVAGRYAGGVLATGRSCGNGATDGDIAIFNLLTVTQTGNALSMRVDFFSATGAPSICTFTGTMTPQGKIGNLSSGQFSCTFNNVAGNAGTFSLSAIEVSQNGLSSTFNGQDQFCTYTGRFGGLRD